MLREELKKIWRPGILLLLVVLGIVYYWMFLEFYVNYFHNNSYVEAIYDVASNMVETYGTTLDSDEFEEFKGTIPALYDEADANIQANSIAQEYGINSYTEYMDEFRSEALSIDSYTGDESDPLQKIYADGMRIDSYLISDETNNIGGRLSYVEGYAGAYEQLQEISISGDIITHTDKEYENAMRLFFGEDNAWQNILPDEVCNATGAFFGYLLTWMLLSACILHAPVLVTDQMRKMRQLQWSSRRGRGILNTQLGAAMLSTFILITINFAILGSLFLTSGTGVFASCRMFSFMSFSYSWVNWSYGTWCSVLILMCYLICLGVSGALFFLSYHSTDYISMLLKLIPLFVACGILANKLMYNAFYYNNSLYTGTYIPMIELIVTVGILLLGFVLSAEAINRQT